MLASMAGHLHVVNYLIEHGADILQKDAHGKTAKDLTNNKIIIAALQKVNVAEELRDVIKKKGPQMDIQTLSGFLDKGVQVNSADAAGNSILNLVVLYKCPAEVIQHLMVTYRASADIANKNRLGPVEMAVYGRDAEVLKCLFESGADIKKNKDPLLNYAAKHGFKGSVEMIKAELGRLLWQAVLSGDINDVKVMLQGRVDYIDEISGQEEFEGWTALLLAAHTDKQEILTLLLNAGADKNKRCARGRTAIAVAATAGNKTAIHALLSMGASVDIADNEGNTALSLAILGGHTLLVRYLLYAGADPEHEVSLGVRVMDIGMKSKDKNIAFTCEQLNFSVAVPDYQEPAKLDAGKPKLVARPKLHHCQPVDVQLGAPPKMPFSPKKISETINNKLLNGARDAVMEAVKQALVEGADIRCKDKKMKTALDLAREGFANPQRIYELSPDPSKIATRKNTYQAIINFLQFKINEWMGLAVQRETLERVQTLHECGASLDRCTVDEPLGFPGFLARSQDNVEIMGYLIQNSPANNMALRAKDKQGNTVLSLARNAGYQKIIEYVCGRLSYQLAESVKQGDVATSQLLLECGAAPELKRDDGETNIHRAVEAGNLPLVKLLVKAGSDVRTTFGGQNMIQIAENKRHKDMVLFLQFSLRYQELREASWKGDLAKVQELHRQGADIDNASYCGDTPLKLAVESGNLKLVHYLVSRGASLVHNNTASPPLTKIAEKKGESFAAYVQRAVDTQFQDAVVEGDFKKLDRILNLGANLNFLNPWTSETAVSLAIRHHGVELLKWIEQRGALLSGPADDKGNYSLGIAAEKGNTAVVEYLLHEININTSIKNNDGKTPVEIAQHNAHNEVVRLLGGEVKESQTVKGYKPPKYVLEELLKAVKNCNLMIINEFIKETYSRRDEKQKHCWTMLQYSKQEKQKEVESKLLKHYYELTEDTSEKKLTGTAQSQVILTGFLKSLSAQITGCALDPSDPRTYDIFFQNMDEKAQEARERILINDLEQMKKHFEEDQNSLEQELTALKQERINMQQREQEYMDRIAAEKNKLNEEKSARERDKIRKELQSLKDDYNTLSAEQKILEKHFSKQTDHKQVSAHFQGIHENLYLFYETIRRGIEQIFISAKAAAGGMTAMTTGKMDKKAGIVDAGSSFILTLVGLEPTVGKAVSCALKPVMKGVTTVMRDVDKYRQKQLAQYISCLATVGELSEIHDSVAYRLTMWYSDQIQCLAKPGQLKKDKKPSQGFSLAPDLGSPAVVMGKMAVSILYEAMEDGNMDKGKCSELATLPERMVWCVVTQKEKDNLIGKIEEKFKMLIGAIKKKVPDKLKNVPGHGYVSDKLPEILKEVSLDPSLHAQGKTSWMLRDLFYRCGIIDKDGNIYENKQTETDTYRHCFGTTSAAVERGLELIKQVAGPSGDKFADEDVIVVSLAGSTTGKKTEFQLNPGKIEERVYKVLERENLTKLSIETEWTAAIEAVDEEMRTRTEKMEEQQKDFEKEARDQVQKAEEVADERSKKLADEIKVAKNAISSQFITLKKSQEEQFKTFTDDMFKQTSQSITKLNTSFKTEMDTMKTQFSQAQAQIDSRINASLAVLSTDITTATKGMENKHKSLEDDLRKEFSSKVEWMKDQFESEKKILVKKCTDLSVKQENDFKNAEQHLSQNMDAQVTRIEMKIGFVDKLCKKVEKDVIMNKEVLDRFQEMNKKELTAFQENQVQDMKKQFDTQRHQTHQDFERFSEHVRRDVSQSKLQMLSSEQTSVSMNSNAAKEPEASNQIASQINHLTKLYESVITEVKASSQRSTAAVESCNEASDTMKKMFDELRVIKRQLRDLSNDSSTKF